MTSVNLNDFLADAFRRQKQGDFRTAGAMYQQALKQYPDHPDTLNLLATLAIDLGQPEPARQLLERAIARFPHSWSYHLNLATAYRLLRRRDEALASIRRALAMAPNEATAHSVHATVLIELGLEDEALAAIERALAINPQSGDALLTLSNIHVNRRRPLEAMAACDRAIALNPQHPAPHWNKALAALTAGDFSTGWAEFEWRQQVFARLRRDFSQPPWKKQDLKGKTILLHCEGGFGDAIQFIRFLPDVVRRAGRVILECPQPLYELFKPLPGPDQVTVRGEPLPPFDFHCPLQSIPFNLDVTLETIPASVPYLRADPQRVSRFKKRVDAQGNDMFKVGLVWSGSETQGDMRSRTLATFAPLAQVPGVRFFSLQVGLDKSQAQDPPAGLTLDDLSPELHDFADTAAAIENLDLVISVDTSVAHLAGALAKPVWTLIPYVPDFRWMLDREDSPWYPTMRLFRQMNRADWKEPLARMLWALRERAGGEARHMEGQR
jgi:tetratricopeptide (TPR) repeat protein